MAVVFTLPCPATLLPTKADLANIFMQLASLPAQFEAEVENVKRSAELQVDAAVRQAILEKTAPLYAAAEKVRTTLNQIDSLLGNFPISLTDPIYAYLNVPAWEWERRITAIVQEYHLYVQAKFMELISKVLPLSFTIPVLGLSIDVVRLFSDAAYRAILKTQIIERIDFFFNLVPEIYRTFNGLYGVFSTAIQAEVIWSYIMSELKKGALQIIYNALGGLIDKFKTIWNALGLPALPALLSLDVKALIETILASIIARIKNAPYELKEKLLKEAVELIESLSIFGFNVVTLIGGEIDRYVTSYEQKLNAYIEALRDFAEDWPQYLIKLWMQKVTAFLNAIGLGELLQWLNFNFCTFLKLIGVPTSISIDIDVAVNVEQRSFSASIEPVAT